MSGLSERCKRGQCRKSCRNNMSVCNIALKLRNRQARSKNVSPLSKSPRKILTHVRANDHDMHKLDKKIHLQNIDNHDLVNINCKRSLRSLSNDSPTGNHSIQLKNIDMIECKNFAQKQNSSRNSKLKDENVSNNSHCSSDKDRHTLFPDNSVSNILLKPCSVFLTRCDANELVLQLGKSIPKVGKLFVVSSKRYSLRSKNQSHSFLDIDLERGASQKPLDKVGSPVKQYNCESDEKSNPVYMKNKKYSNSKISSHQSLSDITPEKELLEKPLIKVESALKQNTCENKSGEKLNLSHPKKKYFNSKISSDQSHSLSDINLETEFLKQLSDEVECGLRLSTGDESGKKSNSILQKKKYNSLSKSLSDNSISLSDVHSETKVITTELFEKVESVSRQIAGENVSREKSNSASRRKRCSFHLENSSNDFHSLSKSNSVNEYLTALLDGIESDPSKSTIESKNGKKENTVSLKKNYFFRSKNVPEYSNSLSNVDFEKREFVKCDSIQRRGRNKSFEKSNALSSKKYLHSRRLSNRSHSLSDNDSNEREFSQDFGRECDCRQQTCEVKSDINLNALSSKEKSPFPPNVLTHSFSENSFKKEFLERLSDEKECKNFDAAMEKKNKSSNVPKHVNSENDKNILSQNPDKIFFEVSNHQMESTTPSGIKLNGTRFHNSSNEVDNERLEKSKREIITDNSLARKSIKRKGSFENDLFEKNGDDSQQSWKSENNSVSTKRTKKSKSQQMFSDDDLKKETEDQTCQKAKMSDSDDEVDFSNEMKNKKIKFKEKQSFSPEVVSKIENKYTEMSVRKRDSVSYTKRTAKNESSSSESDNGHETLVRSPRRRKFSHKSKISPKKKSNSSGKSRKRFEFNKNLDFGLCGKVNSSQRPSPEYGTSEQDERLLSSCPSASQCEAPNPSKSVFKTSESKENQQLSKSEYYEIKKDDPSANEMVIIEDSLDSSANREVLVNKEEEGLSMSDEDDTNSERDESAYESGAEVSSCEENNCNIPNFNENVASCSYASQDQADFDPPQQPSTSDESDCETRNRLHNRFGSLKPIESGSHDTDSVCKFRTKNGYLYKVDYFEYENIKKLYVHLDLSGKKHTYSTCNKCKKKRGRKRKAVSAKFYALGLYSREHGTVHSSDDGKDVDDDGMDVGDDSKNDDFDDGGDENDIQILPELSPSSDSGYNSVDKLGYYPKNYRDNSEDSANEREEPFRRTQPCLSDGCIADHTPGYRKNFTDYFCVHCHHIYLDFQDCCNHLCSGKWIKGFQCLYCEKVFRLFRKLRLHRRLMHSVCF